MSIKPTITAVVLAIIGVVAVVIVRHGDEAPPATSGALLTAEQLPVDAVHRIELRRDGEPAIVFERSASGWTQVEPFPFPMDFFSIRQLAAAAAQVEVVKSLGAADGQRSDLGLHPPRATVTYEWPQGALTLELGRRAVAGRSYLKVLGDPTVFVARAELHERAVEMDPKEWRDRTLFPDISPDQDRVVLDDGDTRIVLRRDNRRWLMDAPIQARVDDSARDALLSALGRAKSGGFILDEPEDLSTFGLADPVGVVQVQSTSRVVRDGETVPEPQRQVLLVGARMGVGSEDRFGMIEGRPVVVRLPEPALRAFFPRVLSLVDPTASGVEPADVKSLVIRGPEGEFRLERDLERWVETGSGREVDAATVRRLLDLLTRHRARSLELSEYRSEWQDSATIILYGYDAWPLDTVRVAQVTATGDRALENGDNVLRMLADDVDIPLTPADFGLEENGVLGSDG